MKILIVCERQLHTSAADASKWIRLEAGKLLAANGVTKVTVSELATASAKHVRFLDWLLEAELANGADPESVAEQPAFSELLHELRSLRLHPVVALLDPAHRSSFSRAGA